MSEWLVTIAFLFVLLVLRRNNMLSISSSLDIQNLIWTTSRHGIERVYMHVYLLIVAIATAYWHELFGCYCARA